MAIFPDAKLALRVERAYGDMLSRFATTCAAVHPELKSSVLPIADGIAAYGGPVGGLTNSVGLGLDGRVTNDDLDRLEAFFRERNTEPAISVCPFADRSLLDRIIQRGYTLFAPLNILYRPLPGRSTPPLPGASIPLLAGAPSPAAEPTGRTDRGTVTVDPVSEATAAAWSRAVTGGFLGQDNAEPKWMQAVKLQCPDTVCFLACVDGEPAGGAAMTIANNAAYFWSASTLPSYRGRGVQTALLQARLEAATAAGCDLAVVTTEIGSGSQRNTQRAGFQVAYTVFDFVLKLQ